MFITPPVPLPDVFWISSCCNAAGWNPLPLLVMFTVNGGISTFNVAPVPAPPVVGVAYWPGA